ARTRGLGFAVAGNAFSATQGTASDAGLRGRACAGLASGIWPLPLEATPANDFVALVTAGMGTALPHPEHLIFRPANSSLAWSDLPQGQEKTMAMKKPLLGP